MVQEIRKDIERARQRLKRAFRAKWDGKKTERALYDALIKESKIVFALLVEGRKTIPGSFAKNDDVQWLDRYINDWRGFIEDPSGFRLGQQERNRRVGGGFTSYMYEVGSLDDLLAFALDTMHWSDDSLRRADNAVFYARRT